MKIVATQKDIQDLEHGDHYIVEPKGLNKIEDPAKLIESPLWKQKEALTKAVEQALSKKPGR